MSFNFGSNQNTSGFSLNANQPTSTTAPGLTFGSGSGDAKSVNKPATNFFGAPTASSASLTVGTATSASGISFGTNSSQSGSSFGAITSTQAVSSFGAKTSASTGFNFSSTTPASTPLSFGASVGSTGLGTATTSSGLNFGATSTSVAPLNFGTPSATTTQSFSLGNTASVTSSAATPQFGFGSKTVPTTSSTLFTPILGSTTTASSGLSLSTSLATTSAAPVSLSFGLSSAAPAATSTATAAMGILPTSLATLTSTTTAPATACMTFAQLEDSINKWTIDLEEQGKFFINQAKQLNAWDSLLTSNGEKILNLNGSIERVKQQQQQLDQELDFVLAQQKELEELIRPLEKELVDIPVTDIDRNQMYQFAEIIDSQLKQMSDDLKEIIEHINDSNKDEEITNPVSQISRILNAHMNSLQWIDRNTAQINAHLEQITKIQDSNRRNFALNHSFNQSFNM